MNKFNVLSGDSIEPQKMLALLGGRRGYTLGELIETLDGEPADSPMYAVNSDWNETRPVLSVRVHEADGRNRVIHIVTESKAATKNFTVGDLRKAPGKLLRVEIASSGDYMGPHEYVVFSIERRLASPWNGIQLRCGRV